MPIDPRHRPSNTKRIESMLNWYMVALEATTVRGQAHIEELYSGKEFKPLNLALTPEHELSLILKYDASPTDNELSEEEEQVIEWHALERETAIPLSKFLYGYKMTVYAVAASLFNDQLAKDQRGDKALGIAPCRLNESPTTPGALQRAIHRYSGRE